MRDGAFAMHIPDIIIKMHACSLGSANHIHKRMCVVLCFGLADLHQDQPGFSSEGFFGSTSAARCLPKTNNHLSARSISFQKAWAIVSSSGAQVCFASHQNGRPAMASCVTQTILKVASAHFDDVILKTCLSHFKHICPK